MLGLILLVAVLLAIRVSVNIKYENELSVYLKILFIKIRLFPEGKVKFNPKKQKKKNAKGTDLPASFLKEMTEGGEKGGLVDTLKAIGGFVSSLLKFCAPYMKIKFARVHIRVATGDAATTAILYGTISGAAEPLIDAIDDCIRVKIPRRRSVLIEPDFLSDKTVAKINVSLSISVFGAISALLKMIIKYSNFQNK